MTRTYSLCVWLAIGACATMHTASPPTLVVTRPAPPANLRDTILQLAIRATIPDSSPGPRRVLLQPPPSVNPHRILPFVSGVTFVTVDRRGFQDLADRVGLITVVTVGAPRIYSDSAEVDIRSEPIGPRGGAIPAGAAAAPTFSLGACMAGVSRGLFSASTKANSCAA